MAILVQKSAGNLSALVAGNEFYATVASLKKMPTNSVFQVITSGTPIYINFTPTAAQDCQGVILSLYASHPGDGSTTYQRNITVELQEDSGGWVTRLTKVLDTDDIIPDNTRPRIWGLVDIRFAATHTLTAVAATWRLKITHDGTGNGSFSLQRSENSGNDNMFHIVYSDTTASLTSSDVLVLTDKITIDDDLELEKVTAVSGSQNGDSARSNYYSIYGCTPNLTDGTVPQIYVPSSVAADYTLSMKGIFWLSSYELGLLAGEDTDNPIPAARTFTIDFNDVSSTNQAGFKAGGLLNTYGKLAGIELWGTIPTTKWTTLEINAANGQADVIVDGDVTSDWAAGDWLEVAGAQFTDSRSYRDYLYNEYRQIDSMAYAAGPDQTTITLTANLDYNHYIQTSMSVFVCNTTRNIIWKGKDGTWNKESHTDIRGGYIKAQGVRVEDVYQVYVAYNYSNDKSPAQRTAGQSFINDCHFHDVGYGSYLYFDQLASEITGCSYSDSVTGTTHTNYGVYLNKCTNTLVDGNVFQARMQSGVYLNSGYGCNITNNYISGQYGIQTIGGVANLTINNNEFLRSRVAIYCNGLGSMNANGNTFRKIYYNSDSAATSETLQGVYYFNNPNGTVYTEDGDADDSHSFINGAAGGGIVHTIKNPTLGSTWTDDVVSEAGATYRPGWLPETEIKFEDYDTTVGDCRAWFTNGYIHSTGTGLNDATGRTVGAGKKAWRFEPYLPDEALKLELTAPVGVANEPITITLYVKLNHLNYAVGTYVAPKLEISGLGMTGDTLSDSADVTTTNWQLLVVSGTPTSVGVITIKLSTETDASGSDSYIYWDDMYISYKTPVDLGTLDNVYHGLPISPPISTQMTAQNVWSELLADNRVTGSMGEAIRNIKWGST